MLLVKLEQLNYNNADQYCFAHNLGVEVFRLNLNLMPKAYKRRGFLAENALDFLDRQLARLALAAENGLFEPLKPQHQGDYSQNLHKQS